MMSQETLDSFTSSTSEDSSRNSTSDNENDVSFEREAGQLKRKTMDETESVTQIRASPSELKRRIAAFIAMKRMEVSDSNIREFCFDLPSSAKVDGEEQSTCARVDSVYVSRVGSCSHKRVTRVVNPEGPQTHRDGSGPQAGRSSTLYQSSVEERLRNAEEHLNITSDSKADMFSRLKAVEEGILFLSGLSPEYFSTGKLPQPKVKHIKVSRPEPVPEEPSPTKPKTEYDNISEIDQRMYSLRVKLQMMKNQLP